MSKKEASEMKKRQEKHILETAQEGAKVQLAKTKKELEELRDEYAYLMEILIHTPSEFTVYKAWLAWRLQWQIFCTWEMIGYYEKAIKSESYKKYVENIQHVMVELSDIPGVMHEEQEEAEFEFQIFSDIFTMGFAKGLCMLEEAERKKK